MCPSCFILSLSQAYKDFEVDGICWCEVKVITLIDKQPTSTQMLLLEPLKTLHKSTEVCLYEGTGKKVED